MQPRSQRRVHGAEFKAQVLAECQQPGASVAAVALDHGLNVNLLRKWLVGRGIKRTGLAAPRTVMRKLTNADDASSPPLQGAGVLPRWWAYRSLWRARLAFALLRLSSWPLWWDYDHRTMRRRLPGGGHRRDPFIADRFSSAPQGE